MADLGVARKNKSIAPQRWERFRRIKNHKKRLEIISLFMTSLLKKDYEDAMMLCMIGLKCEPKNRVLQEYYHLLSEKLEDEDPSSSDISSDEEEEEETDKKHPEKDVKNTKNITENKSDREKAGTHCTYGNDEDADSSTTSEEDDVSETSSDSSESEDFELEVSECSNVTIQKLRNKVVPAGPPPKLNPKWLPR